LVIKLKILEELLMEIEEKIESENSKDIMNCFPKNYSKPKVESTDLPKAGQL
jgi:hypothetical protein